MGCRWPGGNYPNQWWYFLLMHICVTRPQCVNDQFCTQGACGSVQSLCSKYRGHITCLSTKLLLFGNISMEGFTLTVAVDNQNLHRTSEIHQWVNFCLYQDDEKFLDVQVNDTWYVIKWKHFPRYWPFVRGIHRSPVNSPHKGQWPGASMFSLICVWINGWVNNREAGDLRHYRGHYDVTVIMYGYLPGDPVCP